MNRREIADQMPRTRWAFMLRWWEAYGDEVAGFLETIQPEDREFARLAIGHILRQRSYLVAQQDLAGLKPGPLWNLGDWGLVRRRVESQLHSGIGPGRRMDPAPLDDLPPAPFSAPEEAPAPVKPKDPWANPNAED